MAIDDTDYNGIRAHLHELRQKIGELRRHL